MATELSETQLAAITLAFEEWRDTVADNLTQTSIQSFITGDLTAQAAVSRATGEIVTVGAFQVQEEALKYAEEYGKLLKEEGASIIQGEKIAWLKDSTELSRQKTIDLIVQGLEEGKSMDELAIDLRRTFTRNKDYEYKRIARSETARIQNNGALNRYDKLAITHVEVLDNEGPNSCEECARANGQRWTVEYARSHELQHPNCLTKDTKVMGGFNGILRSYYSGPIINIITRLGRRLSVTPNHPILTTKGFIAAKDIDDSTKLVCYADFIKDLSVDADDKHKPVVIEEIFNMLSLLCVVERVPISPEDLHGDAVCGNSYVDIIDVNSHLPYNFKSLVFEEFGNRFLESSPTNELLLNGLCSRDLCVNGISSSSTCIPCSREHLLFFRGGVPSGLPYCLNNFRAGADVNTVVYQSSFDNVFGTSEFITNLRESNAGLIEFDHVTDVFVTEYSDYVYDLLTNTQYYNASGVFIHNCVRAFVPVIPDNWTLPEQ
jgi:SPP1 gp7 family putative phage head morphogenesis protein